MRCPTRTPGVQYPSDYYSVLVVPAEYQSDGLFNNAELLGWSYEQPDLSPYGVTGFLQLDCPLVSCRYLAVPKDSYWAVSIAPLLEAQLRS